MSGLLSCAMSSPRPVARRKGTALRAPLRERNGSNQVAEDAFAVVPASLDAAREVYGVVAAVAHRDESRRIVTPEYPGAVVPMVNHRSHACAASAEVVPRFKNHAALGAPYCGEKVPSIFVFVVGEGGRAAGRHPGRRPSTGIPALCTREPGIHRQRSRELDAHEVRRRSATR